MESVCSIYLFIFFLIFPMYPKAKIADFCATKIYKENLDV